MHQNIDIWHLSIDILHQNVDIWHLNIDIWPNNIGIWHLIIDIWPHNIDIYTEEFSGHPRSLSAEFRTPPAVSVPNLGHPPQFECQILGPKKTLFLHFWTVSRSERPVSTIFPSYIMPNGTCARIKKKCDTLPLKQFIFIYFFNSQDWFELFEVCQH